MSTRRDAQLGHGPPADRAGGFTLIELMTTLFILAILVTLAVPSFNNASLSGKLTGFANDLVASAQLARSEAIKRNVAVTLCASSDGATCDDPEGWEAGWIVVADLGGAGEVLIEEHAALPDDFRVDQAGGVANVVFPATVVAAAGTQLTVCRAEPEGNQERVVTITAARNTRVTTPDPSVGCDD